MENSFISIGSPLIDLIANVSDDFLMKYSLSPNDSIHAQEFHRTIFDEIHDFNPKIKIGGSVTNTARVLQWLSSVPKISCHIGAIGRDKYGLKVQELIKKDKVNFFGVEFDEEETGKCYVMLTGKNRSMCTNLGASKLLRIEDLMVNEIRDVLIQGKFFYMSAFLFGVSFEIVQEIATITRCMNKYFCFNIGAPFLCRKYLNELLRILPDIDIIFANDSEIISLAQSLGLLQEDLSKTLLTINSFEKHKPNKRITVMTRGPRSVFVAHDDKVVEFPICKVDDALIKDTSSAGDAFVGGFMAQFLKQESIEVCVECGVWAAQEIIQSVGCEFDELRRFRRTKDV